MARAEMCGVLQLAERRSVIEALEAKVEDQDRQWEDDLAKLRQTLGQLHSVRLSRSARATLL